MRHNINLQTTYNYLRLNVRSYGVIYALIDPRTNREKYIGQTISPTGRLTQHMRDANKKNPSKKGVWIKSLAGNGMTPKVLGLSFCETKHQLDMAESFWYHYYSERGCNLLNARALSYTGFINPHYISEVAQIEPDKANIRFMDDYFAYIKKLSTRNNQRAAGLFFLD